MVTVNGVPDADPATPWHSLYQIIVFGGKASTDIQVNPDVSSTIPITLDGGHGGDNVIQAGSGPTRKHGWFGHTLLIGGTGQNSMVGPRRGPIQAHSKHQVHLRGRDQAARQGSSHGVCTIRDVLPLRGWPSGPCAQHLTYGRDAVPCRAFRAEPTLLDFTRGRRLELAEIIVVARRPAG